MYVEAVNAWEPVVGRKAPPVVIKGVRGGDVLNVRFVEWMMGLPDGWVTALVSVRTAALKILGNGVVPQQAEAALDELLTPWVTERPPMTRKDRR